MQDLTIKTRTGNAEAILSADLIRGEKYAVTITGAPALTDDGTLLFGLFNSASETLAASVDFALSGGQWTGTIDFNTAELSAAFTGGKTLKAYLIAKVSETENVLTCMLVSIKWAPIDGDFSDLPVIDFVTEAEVATMIEAAKTDATNTASGAIGGHRIVSSVGDSLVALTDLTDTDSVNAVIGLTTGAVESGEVVTLQSSGFITETSWSWTPKQRVFCGASGVPTQTLPASGAIVTIGVAVSATKMLMRIEPPILR